MVSFIFRPQVPRCHPLWFSDSKAQMHKKRTETSKVIISINKEPLEGFYPGSAEQSVNACSGADEALETPMFSSTASPGGICATCDLLTGPHPEQKPGTLIFQLVWTLTTWVSFLSLNLPIYKTIVPNCRILRRVKRDKNQERSPMLLLFLFLLLLVIAKMIAGFTP